MAATDNTSAALTGSSEESTLAKMFKSVLTEIKELKETVAPLVEPAYEDERDDNLEQDDEESTAAGVDKRPANAYMPTLPDYPGVSRIRNESPGLPYGSLNLPDKNDSEPFTDVSPF